MSTPKVESRPDGVAEVLVVLAAGGSSRMGQPKALMPVGDVPLLRLHIDRALTAGLQSWVVLGFRPDAHAAVLPQGVRIVYNPAWASTDMSTSAWLALETLGAAPCLLTPVDVPPARPEVLRRLSGLPGDVVPTFDGLDGHPVRLAPPHVPGRLDLRLARARRVMIEDPTCVYNLNTPEDWRRWQGGPPAER